MMKIAIALLALSTTCAVPAAIAGDAKELLRDTMTFCSQYMIHDPDPRIMLNHIRDCCVHSRNRRDCRLYDWGTIDDGAVAR
jgi:hypothetical protein